MAVMLDSVVEIAIEAGYKGTADQAASILKVEGGFIVEPDPNGRLSVRLTGFPGGFHRGEFRPRLIGGNCASRLDTRNPCRFNRYSRQVRQHPPNPRTLPAASGASHHLGVAALVRVFGQAGVFTQAVALGGRVGITGYVTTPIAALTTTTIGGGGAARQSAITNRHSTISQLSMSGSPGRSMSGPGRAAGQSARSSAQPSPPFPRKGSNG